MCPERTVPERTVAVAGGGIGGLALGIALCRAGIAATVVERAPRLVAVGSGLVLYPNGIAALDAVSPRLGAAVRAAGHIPQPGELRPTLHADGTLLGLDRIGELSRRFGTPQVTLLRSALQEALLAEAAAAGVELRTGLSVTGHADRGDLVEVALSDGSTLTAAALVGADGLHSGVRRRLLGDAPPVYRGYTSVRGQVPAPAAFPSGLVARGPGVDLFAGPVGGGRLYWAAKLTAAAGEWPAKDQRSALADLLAALAGWDGSVVDLVRSTDPAAGLVLTDIADRDPVPQWSFGRVTLLGDAAHPMAPAAGQGASMALEDAVTLARWLRAGPDVPAALQAYCAERAPRTAAVVLHSRRLGGVDAETAGRPGRAVRDFNTRDEELSALFGWRPADRVEFEGAVA